MDYFHFSSIEACFLFSFFATPPMNKMHHCTHHHNIHPLNNMFHILHKTVAGRSALLLSGGANLGSYHWGIIACLITHGILPKILSGSSAGSVVASIVACHSDKSIMSKLHTPNVFCIKLHAKIFPTWISAFFSSFRS